LIVDDERDHAEVMSEALSRLGYACDVAWSLEEARQKLARKRFDVVVTDLRMEGREDGLEVLRESRSFTPPPAVILVTAHADIPTCKRALAEGAYDYIEKPLDLDYFREQVGRAAEKSLLLKQNEALSAQVLDGSGFEGIIARSASMLRVIQLARQVAASDIPILIMGESGTGKELIAKAIHNSSRRRKARLVALNCAGLSESILEDELFGHVKGAFTGAQTDREGRFEHADNGTLFMDEIGDMPQSMQAKLLRVLENGEVVRLGSNEPIKVNVRLISATNRKLEEMVADRSFREDLYFRVKGVTVYLPPLRERREDIPLLMHHFIRWAADRYNKKIDGISPEAQQRLMSYSWPGNVRQLRNVIENMVVLTHGTTIHADVIPADIIPQTWRSADKALPSPRTPEPRLLTSREGDSELIDVQVVESRSVPAEVAALPVLSGPESGSGDGVGDASGEFPRVHSGADFSGLVGISIEQAERELIRNTLRAVQGNREQAAKILGIGERTLYRKIKEYAIDS
jgi:two-component system response regulator HydG